MSCNEYILIYLFTLLAYVQYCISLVLNDFQYIGVILNQSYTTFLGILGEYSLFMTFMQYLCVVHMGY